MQNETLLIEKQSRGGRRKGAGRKNEGRHIPLSVRISQEAMDDLNTLTKNKSEFIDLLIKEQLKNKSRK